VISDSKWSKRLRVAHSISSLSVIMALQGEFLGAFDLSSICAISFEFFLINAYAKARAFWDLDTFDGMLQRLCDYVILDKKGWNV